MRGVLSRSLAVCGVLLLPLVAGFTGMSISLALRFVHAASPGPAPAAAVDARASSQPPSVPERLVIPAIGVNAAVEPVGLAKSGNGAMGVPSNFTNVAWYSGGPLPGAAGDAVIDGHLDGRTVPRAVFYRLAELAPGDTVLVEERAGHVLRFTVTKVAYYPYNASTQEIFTGDATGAHLNLITCAGDWMPAKHLYDERVVVFTTLAPS